MAGITTGGAASGSSRERRVTGKADVLDLLRTSVQLLSWRFAALVALTLAIGLVSGLSAVLLLPMLEVIGLEVSGGTGERIANQVFAVMARLGVPVTLATVLAVNAAVVVIAALLARYQSVVAARLNQSVVRTLRTRLYDSISRAKWLFLTGQQESSLLHLLLAELDRMGLAISSLVSLLVSGARALIYTLIAFVLSPALTALTLLLGLLLSFLLSRRTNVARVYGERLSDAYRGLYVTAQEHLSSMKLTKSHGLERHQAHKFQKSARLVASAHVDIVRNQSDVGFWLEVGSVTGLSVVVYVAFGTLGLPLATVLLVLYLFSRLLPLLASVQRNYQAVLNLVPAYRNFENALRESREAREARESDRTPFQLEHGVELRRVSFGYADKEHSGVEELDLIIPAGKMTALVGPSGSGKSTIADLVIGLLSPSSGEVLIDGEPLSSKRLQAWRERIGYVAQDSFLFNDTVRSNLLVTAPGASDEELQEALSLAAAGFVEHLPKGIDTVVGDRGVRLSGGERQRLVLARALLRRPLLLVLDEATSALDAHSEDRIREAIEKLAGRVTILAIAHRLATVRRADSIHVVEAGTIVESGSWDELVARGGRFAALVNAQGMSEAELVADQRVSSVQSTFNGLPSSSR